MFVNAATIQDLFQVRKNKTKNLKYVKSIASLECGTLQADNIEFFGSCDVLQPTILYDNDAIVPIPIHPSISA